MQGKGAASPFIPCFLDGEEIHRTISELEGQVISTSNESVRAQMRYLLVRLVLGIMSRFQVIPLKVDTCTNS